MPLEAASCPKCGAPIREGRFCAHCGIELRERPDLTVKVMHEGASLGVEIRHLQDPSRVLFRVPGATLDGADLSRANLHHANLRGKSLRQANLKGADLRFADLREADLSEADLSRANIGDANLEGATLIGANLSDTNLDGNLKWADLSRANLQRTCIIESKIAGAKLHGADLRGATSRLFRGTSPETIKELGKTHRRVGMGEWLDDAKAEWDSSTVLNTESEFWVFIGNIKSGDGCAVLPLAFLCAGVVISLAMSALSH
jgi:ribosomal protein L32